MDVKVDEEEFVSNDGVLEVEDICCISSQDIKKVYSEHV